MDLLIGTETGEGRLIELANTTELEENLEAKVEKEVNEDDWVRRIVDELEELKDDLGWSTKEDSNYNSIAAGGEEFAYESTSYGETPKAYGYAAVESYNNEVKSTDFYIRQHEKRLTDAAQKVITRTREMVNMNKMYVNFDINLQNAKDDVKLFRPVMWMLAYEWSGKIEIL
ncbi:hypothetical protein KY329_04360 [Candidatus Woesearchaeota archaeon]|nr:hypothetical protein [Candidatus Woesearchaeota archaeon]